MQHSPSLSADQLVTADWDRMLNEIRLTTFTLNATTCSTIFTQYSEESADVSCFMNSSFSDEIERGDFQKVSGFLQQLRRKMERHQQISSCSKRIFKPPSRQRRIWMANHLDAFKKMQQVFKPGPEPEPKYRSTKRHWQINYRLYQPRTKMIMEKAMAEKPASSMIHPYEDVAFFEWQQDRSSKEDRRQQWLQDLDELDGERPMPQQLSIKMDFSPRCHCDSDTSHCRLLGNSEPWLLDNFGCGFAKLFFNFFRQPSVDAQPFFRMLIQYPMQLEPLELKDGKLRFHVYMHMVRCWKLRDKLGKTMTEKECSIACHFNGVREVLRNKASQLLHSGVASMLRYALLELMPEHECQRRLLPKLEIRLSKRLIVKLPMLIRKGKRRSQLQHDQAPALEELRNQVEEL